MVSVKKLQIMIEEDLDAALGRMARDEGTSKAALIRMFVRERVRPLRPIEEDSIWNMAGIDDFDPGPESIDDVVYR